MHETFKNLGGGDFFGWRTVVFTWKGNEMALDEETQSVRLDWSWLVIAISECSVRLDFLKSMEFLGHQVAQITYI